MSVLIDQSNQIKDDATPALYKIRQRKKTVNNMIGETLRRILAERSNMFSDQNIVTRNGRYVLPVKNNFKKDMSGIVHSYSNSGETIFIEPIEITDLSAELVDLESREAKEIELILQMLTAIINERLEDIEADIKRVVDLDLLFGKAIYARESNSVRPEFSNRLKIVNGYHPVLKRIKNDAVALNLIMDGDKRVLLISGPNAGGKTVVLKTAGLLVLMAKCGMCIPAAEGSAMPFFDELYADIGDEQSLESDLSTFAGHIKQINAALRSSKASCLVLLDELMNQTSVEEGSALAQAILDDLAARNQFVIATTHNENLKIYVSQQNNMLNAGMEYTDHPTYRLITGIPQPSNAIKLAGSMGVDPAIIKKALSYMDKEKVSLNTMFEDLSSKLQAIDEERRKLAQLTAEYDSKLAELKTRKKKEIDDFKEQHKKEMIQAKRTVERLIKALKKDGPKKDTVQKAKEFFEKNVVEEKHEPYVPKVGELVRIHGLQRAGQVIAERQGKFKIGLDNMFFWVEPAEIEKLEPADGDKIKNKKGP
jgi:DNA mismatch repair protein MutS2